MREINEGSQYSKSELFTQKIGPRPACKPFWGEIAWFWPTVAPYFLPDQSVKNRRVLEIGPGYWPVPVVKNKLTVIDKIKGHEKELKEKAEVVIIGDGVEECQKFPDESFGIVCAFHCLEHMVDPELAIKEWWSLVEPFGHFMIAVPVIWYYPSIEQGGGNTDHRHDYTLTKLLSIMLHVCNDIEIELSQIRGDHTLQNKYYEGNYGEPYISYKNDRCCLVIARKLRTPGEK